MMMMDNEDVTVVNPESPYSDGKSWEYLQNVSFAFQGLRVL
jgi:hypothetical protein